MVIVSKMVDHFNPRLKWNDLIGQFISGIADSRQCSSTKTRILVIFDTNGQQMSSMDTMVGNYSRKCHRHPKPLELHIDTISLVSKKQITRIVNYSKLY